MQSELGDRRKTRHRNRGGEPAAEDEPPPPPPPAFCPPELLATQRGVARLARRLHACHAGLASRDAERQLLANARRLATYGLDVHEARCIEAG
uniref:FERM domain-containing protein n=1 Tax=Macrostomum lignano TaxID=282301 RepID=A0A1I8HPI0_9PLAT